MKNPSTKSLLSRIEELESRLGESEQLIEAIKAGEVDAFAVNKDNKSEVFTLQTGDYAYRILIENFGEGALNLTEDGLIVYTNTYFYNLVNLTYEKAVGTYFSTLLHPDSKEKFKELFRKGIAGQSKGEINLQVNDQIIPVYVSLTSLYPTLPTVGVIVTDLTEKKKQEEVILNYQKNLEHKNIELLQSNAELASFSYMASHDLQEPLRKIQTFSSRILEKEKDELSPVAQDYFQRIIGASEGMQNLITALLDYSRMNTSQMLFEPTNLNKVLEDVKNNLNVLVEETHAVIESAPLPVVRAVPHQVNQLMTNLIMNAIKYRQPQMAPRININVSVVEPDDIEMGNNLPKKKYFKISISDNGIGFDQRYAKKIFEIFQRLHNKTEFEGTGIGLAICKKIAHNHGGMIEAESKKGVGSTFHIYLPYLK
jgi:PAS domain S-box-containing protein